MVKANGLREWMRHADGKGNGKSVLNLIYCFHSARIGFCVRLEVEFKMGLAFL